MGKRHKAREYAVQCLYQWEVTHADPAAILDGFWESQAPDPDARSFAESLVLGTIEHADELDGMIDRQASHWRVERLGLVEKSILRLGGYELVYEAETPAAVAIDEAVELAKRFSGPEAAQFVNGVLDGMHGRLDPAVSENGVAGAVDETE